MIKLFIFIILVAKALPLFIYVTDQSDLLVFSLIILYPAVDFTVFYSAIGSGIIIYIGLRSSIKKLVNLIVNGLFCSFIVFTLLVFNSPYLLTLFNLYFLVIFNPVNYLGSELYFYGDFNSFYLAFPLTFIKLKPFNIVNDIYNSNIKLMSSISKNMDLIYKQENSKTKLNKDLRKIIGGGYLSYNNIESIGFVNDLLDNKPIFIKKLDKYLDNLETNKTYTLLPVIRWINDDTGFSNSITVSNSLKIHKFVDKVLLAENISKSMRKSLHKYNLIQNNSEIVLMNRVWLDLKDFNIKENDISTLTNTMDNLLANFKSEINKDDLIMKRLSIIENDIYSNIIMDNYGEIISSNGISTEYTLNSNQFLSVKKANNTNFITVKNIDNSDQNIMNWSDTKTDFGFIRNIDSVKYFFNQNGTLFKTESSYNFLDYPVDNINSDLDEKIGSIDFETFGEEGIGIQNVYAAGWAINDFNKTKKFYYIDKDCNSLDVVKNLISDLANNKEINGFTFYAHNLGRFDSVFLIKACILLDDIIIKPKWKENKILSITILNTKTKTKFKILDSIQMLNGSLDSLCKSFKIVNQKGIFPHSFVNKDNLFYIGDTPSFIYFKNMPLSLYNKINTSNWDLKSEALKYLHSDVLGLLEVMTKFNEKIYNLYSLNITNFVTAPKLAAAIFTSNFYKDSDDLKIKMIRGNVEKEIREAYFGGNVDAFINKIDKAYYYDMNSQYPFAMLNDLPVGNPTLTNDTNLNNYFGFVYGEITAPNYERLRIPYIQMRDEKTDNISCPRGSFSRMIFSEEMKEAIKDGYSIKVKYGYKFERGINLFKNYVDTFYNIKKTTKDPVEKALSKLLLNSLYGKFGMKDIISNMKILSKKEANKITKNYNYSIFAELGEDKVLVKYSSKLPEPLTSLIKDKKDKLNEIPISSLSRKRGVPSAVHISAAISAYARMSINKFKNIPGNPCIYSDTDSVVLPKTLPLNIIGKELGQMKLEHQIEKGIFIRKKLYAIIDNMGNLTVKSSGVKSSTLNFEKFKLLLDGHSVICKSLSFEVLWKELNINIVNKSINLKGLSGNIIDIKNHYDINFKAIVPYNAPRFKDNNRKFRHFNIVDIPVLIKTYRFFINNLLKFFHYIYIHMKLFWKIFKKDS